jgi:hypothetical protein
MTSMERSSVKFKSIEIIELAFAIGDNPSVSDGVPLSMEWDALNRTTMGLEFFEQHRPPRSNIVSRLNGETRSQLLQRNGFSSEDIETATENAKKARKKRRKTVRKLLSSTTAKVYQDAFEEGALEGSDGAMPTAAAELAMNEESRSNDTKTTRKPPHGM